MYVSIYALQNTRRLVITERKQAKQQKDEADRYAAAQAELGKLKTTHKMMQLYYLDQDISTKETSLVDAARRLEEATGKEESMATQWAELGKAAASAAQRKGKLSSQMQSKTKDAREKDEKVQQLKDAVGATSIRFVRSSLRRCGACQACK